MSAPVSLERVTKVYDGSVKAVDDVSLDVAAGEFVVLVGPSGCGKSTILRMIAGLEDASEGEIRIGGRLVNNVPPKNRDIAMVFQNYALYPHMTVYRNMAFALRARRLPKPEIGRRVREVAAILEIDELLMRRPGELSGGQRQRVAMGRAMVRQPQVFLFDEPLSNLDAKLRHQMRGEIKKLHQKVQTTMVYVTHDQTEAMTLADRIGILRAGRVEQIGTPVEVYRRPGNLFVAGFIGTPAMNFLPARIEAGGGAAVAVLGDGTRWALPAPMSGGAAPERPVTLGIRPDDLRFVGDGAGEREGEVTAAVSVVEPLGNETLLSVTLAGQEVTAKAEGLVIPAIGDRVRLVPRLANLHLFDPATGAALR